MTAPGVAPHLVQAWLVARSIGRGLSGPVADRGGFRVDTQSDSEVVRWVFPAVGPGLEELGRSIREPRHFLKLCGACDLLRAVLPDPWHIEPPGYFMETKASPRVRPLAEGYRADVERSRSTTNIRVLSDAGELAASGSAAETDDAFIYDRIVTLPEHRRKGLGHFIMWALGECRSNSTIPQLLVATEEGRALYEGLGWKTISPLSTASLKTP